MDEFGAVAPFGVLGIGEGDALGVAGIPGVLGGLDFLPGGFEGERGQGRAWIHAPIISRWQGFFKRLFGLTIPKGQALDLLAERAKQGGKPFFHPGRGSAWKRPVRGARAGSQGLTSLDGIRVPGASAGAGDMASKPTGYRISGWPNLTLRIFFCFDLL